THLEGLARDEAGLVYDAQVGHVGLGGPAAEPGRHRLVERKERHNPRQGEAYQRHRPGHDGQSGQDEERAGDDPEEHRRAAEDPVRIGGIQHLFTGLQNIVDVTTHYLTSVTPAPQPAAAGPRPRRNPLAPGRAAMYTRLSVAALPVLSAWPIYPYLRNARV